MRQRQLLLTMSACVLLGSLGFSTLNRPVNAQGLEQVQEARAGESLEDFKARGGHVGFHEEVTQEGDNQVVTFTKKERSAIPIDYDYVEKIHKPFGWEEKTKEGVPGEIETTVTIRFVNGIMTRSDTRDRETKTMEKGTIEMGSLYETFYYGSYDFKDAEDGGMNQVPFEKERTYQRGHNANIDPLTGDVLLEVKDRIVLVGNYKHIRDVGVTPESEYVLDTSMPADSRDKLVQTGTRSVITTDVVYQVDENKGTLFNPQETVQEFPGRPNIYHYSPVSIPFETDIRTIPYSDHGEILTIVQPGRKGLKDPRTDQILEAPQPEVLEIMEGYVLVQRPNGGWDYEKDPNFNDSSSTGDLNQPGGGGSGTGSSGGNSSGNSSGSGGGQTGSDDDDLVRFDSESIEYETKYEFDPDLPAGERVVKQEGFVGVWDEKKGQVIVEPVDEILVIGGKITDIYEPNPDLPKGEIETTPGRDPEIDLDTGQVIEDGEATRHSVGTKEVIEEEIHFETERLGDPTADPNAEDTVIQEGENGVKVIIRQHEIDPETGEFTGKYTDTVEEGDVKNQVVSGYPKSGDTNWEELIQKGIIDSEGNLIQDKEKKEEGSSTLTKKEEKELRETVPIEKNQVTQSGPGLLHRVVVDNDTGNRYAQVLGDGMIYDRYGQLIGDGHLYDAYGHRVGSSDDLSYTGAHRGFRSRYYNPNEGRDSRFDLGNGMRLAELYDSQGSLLDLTHVYTSQGQRVTELDLRDQHGRKLWGDNRTLAAPGSASYQQQTQQLQNQQLPRQQQLQGRQQEASHSGGGGGGNDLPTTGEAVTNAGLLGGIVTTLGAFFWPKRKKEEE